MQSPAPRVSSLRGRLYDECVSIQAGRGKRSPEGPSGPYLAPSERAGGRTRTTYHFAALLIRPLPSGFAPTQSAYKEAAGWSPRRSLCLLRLGAMRRSNCEVGGMTRSAIELDGTTAPR